MRFLLLLVLSSFTGFSQLPFFLQADTSTVFTTDLSLLAGSRNTYLRTSDQNRVLSVGGGIKFGEKRHKLLLTYNWLNTSASTKLFHPDRGWNSSSFIQKDVHFYNLLFAFAIMNSPRWRVTLPLELGYGSVFQYPISLTQGLFTWTEASFWNRQAGIKFDWKASRYIGINYEFGKRWVPKYTYLTGNYFGFGISIYPRPFIRDFSLDKKIKALLQRSNLDPLAN